MTEPIGIIGPADDDETSDHTPIYTDTLSRDTLNASDYISPDDSAQVTALLQEANTMENPTITVIGALNGAKVVRADFGEKVTTTMSDRTIAAVAKLGITVVDSPDNYVL